MKQLPGLLIFFLLGMTLPAHANDQDVQAELLLTKIDSALKNDRMSEALSACAKLEKLGPSLSKPLPEIFYFNYIETMHRSGGKESVLDRSYTYLQKYGKKARHYSQVTAIIAELQRETMKAGNGDADAAVIAHQLQSEKEHEQTFQALRACQGEAIALEATEKELGVEYEAINTQSEALLAAKAALDQRMILIDRAGPGMPEEQKQMRIDFNRDSQAYDDAVSAFSRARDLYAAKEEGYDHRHKGYADRCGNLLVLASDLEAVCGESDDWFCRDSE